MGQEVISEALVTAPGRAFRGCIGSWDLTTSHSGKLRVENIFLCPPFASLHEME